jgi:hypothetical protein
MPQGRTFEPKRRSPGFIPHRLPRRLAASTDDADLGRPGTDSRAREHRALAPDLARGLMLLLIALANTPWYLYDSTTGSSSIHRPTAPPSTGWCSS